MVWLSRSENYHAILNENIRMDLFFEYARHIAETMRELEC
jgi:hypothetical protein